MARARPLRNASLATRVALVALAVTLVSLGVTAAVGLQRGASLAGGIVDDRLLSVAAARGESVEFTLTTVRRQVGALAASPGAADAVTGLTAAFDELDASSVDSSDVEDLTEFYLTDVVPQLEDVRGAQVGASFLVPDSPGAVHLQRNYTMPSEDSDIEPSLVLDPGDGSTYSELHATIHQTYGQIAIASGFDDLFLITADEHIIVYSLKKRIDFGTSLGLGPHSGSSLARLVEQLETDTTGGPIVGDYTAYVPAFERPTAFVAAPILDRDGVLVGHIAASLSIRIVDELLSGGGTWDGFGETGEAYLVGADGTMRSTARTFQTSASQFLASAPEEGAGQLTDAQRRRMAQTGTTALVQDTNATFTAAEGTTRLDDTTNYRGVPVRKAVRPLAIDGVEWTIVTEVARDELEAPVRDYARQMLLVVALFVVIVTFVVVRRSDRLVAPIRRIATRLRTVRTSDDDEFDDAHDPGPSTGPAEYEQLSSNVDEMLERLRERRAEIAARAEERAALLRRFLPAAVARRSEEGDGEVLDHVRNASVVVMNLAGLDELLHDGDPARARDLLAEVVDDVDALAAESGLERVKVTGTTYYAVCGVSRPVLDHAPRSVQFALAARDLVDELSDGRLTVRGAVVAGPVSTGLAARTALLYDVWGDTVVAAEGLANSAEPATIVVTDSVRSQLPREFVVIGDVGGSAVVTGRLALEEGRR